MELELRPPASSPDDYQKSDLILKEINDGHSYRFKHVFYKKILQEAFSASWKSSSAHQLYHPINIKNQI